MRDDRPSWPWSPARRGRPGRLHEIVERYAPLVWSICVRYQLNGQHAEDVGQTVWLLLVEQLGKLREPAALPAGSRPPPRTSAAGGQAAGRIEDLAQPG